MKAYEEIPANRLGDTYALYPSDAIYSGQTVAGVELTLTVPTGADFCIFSCNGDYYVNYDLTATVPAGSITQAGGELNPNIRYVGETTTLHVISDAVVNLTLQFFAKND